MARLLAAAVTLAGAISLISPSASGQTALYVRTLAEDAVCSEPGCKAQLITADPAVPAVRRVENIDDRAPAAYVFPDGSLTVGLRDASTARAAIVVRSPATGASVVVAAPMAGALLGNPVRPEVYFNDSQGPIAASFAGLRRLTLPPCSVGVSAGSVVSVSADGRRVAYLSCFGASSGIAVIDTASGVTVGTLPMLYGGSLSADGATFYTAFLTYLRRFDVATGAVVAEVDFSPVSPPMPVVDWATGLILYTDERIGGRVFDANLQFVRAVQLSAGVWQFDPHRPRAYQVARFTDGDPPVTRESVRVIDTTTWATLVSAPLAGTGPRASLVASYAPAGPVVVPPVVVGRVVQLAWAPGGPAAAVTRYVLEAGSAPGLNDIISGFDVGLQTSFSASGVPSGRYYVRVRAGNYTGLSAPSNEVVVQVP